MTPLNGSSGSRDTDNGSIPITPPAAWMSPAATLRAWASRVKVSLRSVSAAAVSSAATVTVWPGAVTSGARLVKSMTPFKPFTGPAGLTKSRPGMVRRPALDPPSPKAGLQSKRPEKSTAPLTGERTKSATSGVRSWGWSPSGANTSPVVWMATPPAWLVPSWARVMRPTGWPAGVATLKAPVQRSSTSEASPEADSG